MLTLKRGLYKVDDMTKATMSKQAPNPGKWKMKEQRGQKGKVQA